MHDSTAIATAEQSAPTRKRVARKARASKADAIRAAIRRNWRTHSDRQIADMAGSTHKTIGIYRRKMEEAGKILPRFDESIHGLQPRLQEVDTCAIEPAPENDKLYDPVREDDPALLELVKNIRENGIINSIRVSGDGFIYDGHRRYAAARRLKMRRITIWIDPGISRIKDLDGFVRRLTSCNQQRVKNVAEKVRESMVTMEPGTFHRVCDYRESVSNVNGVEVFSLVGEKKRSAIAQKRTLRDAIIRTVKDRYARMGRTNVRKIFYLLLNIPGLLRNDVRKTPFENTPKCYQDVTDMLARLRLDGSIPFGAIVDETRPVIVWATHRDVGPFIDEQLDEFLCRYCRDLMQSQPNHIELLIEKNTVAADLKDLAAKYTIPMTSGRGYSSLPPRKGMVDRFLASGKEKLIVVVVADFDAEGQDIPNAFGLSLRDDFGIDPDKLVIIKAALTHQQTQELDLHEGQWAKEDSARYDRFVKTYGKRCWELEAVNDDQLQEIIEATIRRTIDLDAFNDELATQEQERDDLDVHQQSVREALADIEWEVE